MQRKLLLLGLLRNHEMHGYQINELIDMHLGTSVQLTKPTAYRLLDQMAEDGWITYHEEKVGNRPTRRIYAITEKGEVQFKELLKACLGDYRPANYAGAVCLAFMDALPPEEILPLLEKRRSSLENLLAASTSDESHHGSFQLVIEHEIRHLKTELEWLTDIITHLKPSDGGHEVRLGTHSLSHE